MKVRCHIVRTAKLLVHHATGVKPFPQAFPQAFPRRFATPALDFGKPKSMVSGTKTPGVPSLRGNGLGISATRFAFRPSGERSFRRRTRNSPRPQNEESAASPCVCEEKPQDRASLPVLKSSHRS